MTYFQILIRILKDFKDFTWNPKFYLMVFVLLLTTILGSSEPFFGAQLIKYIEWYFQNQTIIFDQILIFMWIYMGFIVVNSIIRYIYRYYFVDVFAMKYYIYHAQKYKEKVIRMSEMAYLNKKSWSLYKTFDRGAEWVFQVLFWFWIDVAISLLSIVGLTIIMLYLNITMAIATLGMVPVMIYMGIYFNKKTRATQNEIHKVWDSFFAQLWDYLSNLTLVKTLTLESKASKELEQIQEKALSLQLPLSKRWAVADVYVQFLVNISRFFVLWLGIYLISKWELWFAELFLYFTLIWFIYYPMNFLFAQFKNFQKTLEWIKRFYEEFDSMDQDIEKDIWKNLANITGNITFENVGFQYKEGNEDVIKNLSFHIKAWQKVALVGSTGSGKTTLTKLLLRLFELKSGKILIDDYDISESTKSSLRQHIGIVMQENSLFNTSIYENMLFAKPDATQDEIESALKNAKADFVFKLEKWVHTEIWERWVKLSWWEKQRINIARIFLKNPEILILDEATSALDNKTEIEIQKSLDTLMEWKTSLIIAHRLSTIKKVDVIFVLENGKIIEQWNYEELIEKKWKFFELANPEKLILN